MCISCVHETASKTIVDASPLLVHNTGVVEGFFNILLHHCGDDSATFYLALYQPSVTTLRQSTIAGSWMLTARPKMPLPLFSSESSSSNLPTDAFGSPFRDVTIKMKAINALQDINIYHFAFKTMAYTWLAFMIWIAWKISPFSGAWTLPRRTDRIPIRQTNIARYTSIL